VKKIVFLFFILVGFGFANAQDNTFLKVYDHKKLTGNTLKVFAEDGLVAITVIKPNLVEVAFLKQDVAIEAVKEKIPEENYLRVTQNLENIYLQTDSLMLVISKLNFSIQFKSYKNQTLLVVDSAQINNQFSTVKFTAAKASSFKNTKGKAFEVKEYPIKNKSMSLFNNSLSLKFEQAVSGNLDFKRDSQFWFKTNNSSALVFQFHMAVVE
jgi:hypothetical protein